jgi:hypothetical protein
VAKPRSVYRAAPAEAPDPRFPGPAESAESAPQANPVAARGAALRVQPGAGAPESPVARLLRRELARTERLKAQLATLEADCQTHLAGRAQHLQPLRERLRAGQRDLVLALARWLEPPARGLSRTQQASACARLCQLTRILAEEGDAEMAALHDRHSPRTLTEQRLAAADTLRARLADWLDPDDAASQQAADADALLHAARAQWQAEADARQAKRQARADQRAARQAQRGPRAAEQLEAQAQQDADALLRGVYRQLASALHPDRAPDEAERARMNALMSEANAAYARKDLLALLRLQWQSEQVDAEQFDRLSNDRLESLTRLLRQQAAGLERERQIEQQRWLHRLDLPAGMALTARALQDWLEDAQHALQADLAALEREIEAARELATLKPWLNAQREQRNPAPDRLF